ncbi:DEAD/DEAH box helicase [Serpentinicella alkaliphila]|uniref:SNF2 family DNA or RNA helicase n=1 Tax=Serpentinicella alkaliphila TaxID=1734049 RepID=A0A4R2TML1_9FIRM|nr:DEAD/DEAH box helicase [Serpentinicella alkaliphila]QUH25014.1 SNF2 helicase associated domain-containing protein [Serpentinicella alkaliphila]TCQ02505.1 SNF2 family DNA or RNA helicase [Serpentinicella alkaliphila]
MFNIDDELLRDIASYQGAYTKGVQYYRQRKVTKLTFDPIKNKFKAQVNGTYNYKVEAEFDTEGSFLDGDCSCPAHDGYYGHCKHIVALLLDIKEKDQRGLFSEKKVELYSNEILDYFKNINNDRIPVKLEITLEISKGGFRNEDFKCFLSLRIGIDRLYIVKNMRTFISAIYRKLPINFGVNFTFNPGEHKFKDSDQKLIDMIVEMYEHEQLVDHDYYGNSSNHLFMGKHIQLSTKSFERFLKLLQTENFDNIKFEILGRPYGNLPIYEGELPVQFILDKKNKDMELNLSIDKKLIPLDYESKLFLTEDGICIVPEKQRMGIRPFLSKKINEDFKLKIPKEEEESFITNIFPRICEIGEVEISSSLKEQIYSPELKSEIYFDKKEDQIVAKLIWSYGDIKINPFTTFKREENDRRILIRDIDKEKAILDYFEKNEFKVRNGEAYLQDEDLIFSVINKGFKELQKNTDIYYSESFKTMEIKAPSLFSGGVRFDSELDLLEFHFDIEGISDKELKGLLKSLRKKKKYFRLKEGSFIPLDDNYMLGLNQLMERLDITEDDILNKVIELPKYKALYFDELLKENDLSFIKRNKGFKKFIEDIKDFDDVEYMAPKEVEGVLRKYQLQGMRWLKTLTRYGLGGILADDMGLGKSLQILSYLLSEKNEKGKSTALIVSPTSLVYNWLNEIEKFTPQLKALAIVGNKGEREDILKIVDEYDIVITSYPLIRRDADLYESISFNYCILDEAQHIKNPLSQSAKSVKGIKAKHKFALTGTPIENSLTELWSIFDFVMPGYLASHNKFKNRFEKPIIKDRDENSLKELGKLIRPFLLRRLKKQVLTELPEKTESKMVTDLTREQKQVYLAYLKEIKGEIEDEIKRNGFERSQIKILAGLTRLRQICCHPALFLDNYKGGSGKMELLNELLESYMETDNRILLFSQFTSNLALIKERLDELNIDYFYLDGSTPMIDRGEMVNRFNEGKGKIFLISLRAGGTGLNLTGADTVIHFDPWWNPAVEDQATDRAYRIGQKNRVQVIKLITKGTIEEKIFDLQEKKKEMINAVIQPGETMLSKITSEELLDILDTILVGA